MNNLETITKKTVSIEFEGKEYVLTDEITLDMFLAQLGLPQDMPILLKPAQNGFSLSSKV